MHIIAYIRFTCYCAEAVKRDGWVLPESINQLQLICTGMTRSSSTSQPKQVIKFCTANVHTWNVHTWNIVLWSKFGRRGWVFDCWSRGSRSLNLVVVVVVVVLLLYVRTLCIWDWQSIARRFWRLWSITAILTIPSRVHIDWNHACLMTLFTGGPLQSCTWLSWVVFGKHVLLMYTVRSGLGQSSYTCLPLSASSMLWY